ncbi:unnamed protein product [Prunus armeniaca]|uniref:Uncharacterized protein n=1 Tax=Prunus armeniaca TaxID=36596 RepID=A0A6J5WLR3_PRUAR|nr:unnamed protein product [Prunus armeniaca]
MGIFNFFIIVVTYHYEVLNEVLPGELLRQVLGCRSRFFPHQSGERKEAPSSKRVRSTEPVRFKTLAAAAANNFPKGLMVIVLKSDEWVRDRGRQKGT